MSDDYIKAHDEQIRVDERAKLAKKLGGIEALAIKLRADIAALKGQAGSATDTEGSAVNAKTQPAQAAIEWAAIEADVRAVLGQISVGGAFAFGGALSQPEIVTRTGQDPKLISRALLRLVNAGKVHASGKNRAKRYWLPVAQPAGPVEPVSDLLDGEAQTN